MLGMRKLRGHIGQFGKALKNTANTAIGLPIDEERTAVAKHDVHHGTNFWQHISNNNFDEAQNSLSQMKNPALKETGQALHKGLKLVNKVLGGQVLTSGIGGTYRRLGHVLGKAVGAKDMTNELKQYENAGTNESIRGPQEKHEIQKTQEEHFQDAIQDTITMLTNLLDSKTLDEKSENTIREVRDNFKKFTGGPLTPNNQTAGSSCSRKHRKSKKHGKSKNSKKSKKITRKHRGGAKKTRKSKRKTSRKTKRKY